MIAGRQTGIRNMDNSQRRFMPPQQPELYTPAEVAALFRVDPKTVTRWAKSGKLVALRTLGGHRRFHRAAVDALLARSQS